MSDPATAAAVAVLDCTTPGESWWKTLLSVITPLLILLSATIAWRSLKNTRAVARQKATLDLIEKAESTEHYRTLSTAFAAVRKARGFDALHDPQDATQRRARQNVLDYLNHYELVAIGIAHDILDDTIYRTWMQSHVVMEWNAAAQFIQNERWRLTADGTDFEYRAAIFGNLQRAVCRWSPEAAKLDARWSPKPSIPPPPQDAVPPGDAPLPVTNPLDESEDA